MAAINTLRGGDTMRWPPTRTTRTRGSEFHEEVADREWYLNGSIPSATETIKGHGGAVIIGGLKPDVVAGERDPSTTVAIEFPTIEGAHRWIDGAADEEGKSIPREANEHAHRVVRPGSSPDDRLG